MLWRSWDRLAHCRSTKPLPCWWINAFNDLYLHNLWCVNSMWSHLLFHGSHLITNLWISAAFHSECHRMHHKVSPYMERCKLESLGEDSDMLLCMNKVCPHTFIPEHMCLQVEEQGLSTMFNRPWLQVIPTSPPILEFHISLCFSLSFSLLLVFMGLIRSYTLDNGIQPTCDCRPVRKN